MNALDPRFRASRLRSLAQHTLDALGVVGKAPDEATILEHSIQQACAELEAVEEAIGKLDETSVWISVVAGIRHRLELATESGDLLAALLAEPVESEAAL